MCAILFDCSCRSHNQSFLLSVISSGVFHGEDFSDDAQFICVLSDVAARHRFMISVLMKRFLIWIICVYQSFSLYAKAEMMIAAFMVCCSCMYVHARVYRVS
jgi:hypothetical protein